MQAKQMANQPGLIGLESLRAETGDKELGDEWGEDSDKVAAIEGDGMQTRS